MPSTLRIQLLGEFRLFVNEQPFDTLKKPRQQALLAYLLLNRHAPQSRQQVAFSFWPDTSEGQAYTNLRKVVFQLRAALPIIDDFILVDTQSLVWRQDASFSLDVAELEQALDLLEQASTSDAASVERVVTLYRGELLPNCYDDWLLPLRRELHERVVNTLTKMLAGLEAQHEYEVALRTAEHLLQLDPLHEVAYRHLMHLRALSGDRTGALRIYHECVTILEQELGVSPALETQALYQQLLKAEPQGTPAPVQRHEHVPLVGRRQEWYLLQQAWQQMTSRSPHMVTVWGEAGVGKTRLVEELLRWAKLRPGTVAYARSYAAEGALSYAPITDWLRSDALRPVLGRLEPLWLSEVARLLPQLLSDRPDLPQPVPMTEGWQRRRFHEALARTVLAASSPCLLVLDDLQWCDEETLAWLQYLLRFDARVPILVVGTVRSEAVDEQHPLHDLRQQLQREAQWTELTLAPLNVDETTVLAGHLTNEDITSWSERIYRETEGNPLFVVEMIRAGLVVDQDKLHDDTTVALPPVVQAVIAARLAQLSSPARQLAQLAATIGRAFTHELLAVASGADDDALVQGVDELWRKRLIREQSGGYDFSHDKIREVAYNETSPVRQRQHHSKIANALEIIYQQNLDPFSGQVAAHWEAAGDSHRASLLFQRAGLNSANQFAISDALRYLSRAVELSSEHETERHLEILLTRVRIYNLLGRRREEFQDLETLQRLLSTSNLPTIEFTRWHTEVELRRAQYGSGISDYQMVKSAAQAAVELAEPCQAVDLLAQAYLLLGSAEVWIYTDYNQARPHLERALTLAHTAGLLRIEAETQNYMAVLGLYTGDSIHNIVARAQQALALYQKIGDQAGEAFSLATLAYIDCTQGDGDHEQAKTYCYEALRISPENAGWEAERSAAGNLGWIYRLQGNYSLAQPYLERELSITRQVESPGPQAGGLLGVGCLYFEQGDYGEAKVYLEEALRLLRGVGGEQYEVKVLSILALLYAETGENDLAFNYGEQAVRLAQGLGDPRLEGEACQRLGRVLLYLGKVDAAEQFFEHALTAHRNMEQRNRSLYALAGLAETALRQNRVSLAQEYIEHIMEQLTRCQLEGTDEALTVYLACYQVLDALQDARSLNYLHMAHKQLLARASTIGSEERQRLFWSKTRSHTVLDGIKCSPGYLS